MLGGCARSDTPHHLKNKRIQHGALDKDAVSILLANAPPPTFEPPHNQNDSKIDDPSGVANHLTDGGKFFQLSGIKKWMYSVYACS